MAKFAKSLRDWKIRRVAFLFLFLLALLAVTNFLIVYFFGITTEDLIVKDKVSKLSLAIRELHPDNLEGIDEANLEEKIFRIDVELLETMQGSTVQYEGNEFLLSPIEEPLLSDFQGLIKNWELYKSAILGQRTTSDLDRLYTSVEIKSDDIQSQIFSVLQKKRENLFNGIAFSIVFNILIFVALIMIMRYLIMGPIFKISLTSRKLAKGNLSERIRLKSQNEIGYIAQNINSLVDILKSATEFSQSIGQGNLDVQYKLSDNENISDNHLATSLIGMRDQMKSAAQAEFARNWVTQGLAQFADILRRNNDNLQVLADELLTALVKYLNANQGAIFVQSEDNKNELQLIATYAYERRKKQKMNVQIGEGLVGQAFREKDTLYITEIPEEYIKIKSGLGERTPNYLLVSPLIANETVNGVIEIASFEDILPYQREFVEKLGETISATISTTRINEKTKKLLEESRQMTEELRAQEEEMRQNMEEMQATQEEMRRAQLEVTKKEANLNALINNTEDSIITMDRNYKIMLLNEVQRNRYKGTQYEGITEGSNALEMLGAVRDEWKGYYDKALAGERLDFVIKSSVKGEDTYRQYFINPIRDQYNEVIGLSVFSRNVTGQKLQEIQNRILLQDLSQKNKLFDSFSYFLELNAEKHITKINARALEALSYSESELIGQHINILLPEEGTLRSGLEMMLKGEVWQEDIDLKAKDGSLIPVHSASTSVLNNDGQVEKFAMVFYRR
ncbi:GAF domain-containing protein [Cytophagales bacterium LB-30]|uniref:GAF domain-containing protein n=1 Tax=Shiella aurantiaca TaxID=3058365 RepID=A0ABT8F159_9BACT|nr:GAF domain-containing protein [Shiella aurantiaca]MDN4164089.1 GAF domain-containing protein [Shiella aurantiaca]